MVDGFLQVPPDAAGKKLLVFGPRADSTYVEAVAPVDAYGDQFPESPKIAYLTSTNLAAGASINLETPDITAGTTGRLIAVLAAASIPLKVVVIPLLAGVAQTAVGAIFTTDARLTDWWRSPHPDWVREAGGTTNRWRLAVTNQDNIDAADVYLTAYWDEVS